MVGSCHDHRTLVASVSRGARAAGSAARTVNRRIAFTEYTLNHRAERDPPRGLLAGDSRLLPLAVAPPLSGRGDDAARERVPRVEEETGGQHRHDDRPRIA